MLLVAKDYEIESLEEPVWCESSFNWYSQNGIKLRLHPLQHGP